MTINEDHKNPRWLAYIRELELVEEAARKKQTVKRVAQAIKRPPPESDARFKATDRYGVSLINYRDYQKLYER